MPAKPKSDIETIWVPIIVAVIALIGPLIGTLITETKFHPEQVDPPPSKETLTIAVRDAAAEAQRAIREARGDLTCFQQVIGPNVNLTFAGTKDFYPLNEYRIEDAPQSRRLADHLLKISQSFSSYKGKDFKISLQVAGTADANPLSSNLHYDGLDVTCSTDHGMRSLRPGPASLDNELLGCARAADFLRYLKENQLSTESDVSGREFHNPAETTGTFRYISTTLTFHNLATLLPEVKFC
jgi:hypothetical protein